MTNRNQSESQRDQAEPDNGRADFSADMAQARQRLHAVSELALQQYEQALNAYQHNDVRLAQQVLSQLQRAQDFELAMDDHCLDMLSHTASNRDLRLVLALLKAISDIEQICHQNVQIAQQVLLYTATPPSAKQLAAISTLAKPVGTIMGLALAALHQRDIVMAEQALSIAPAVHQCYGAILRGNLAEQQQAAQLDATLSVNWVARALERIAEHSTNLARQAIFMARVSSGHSSRVELQPRLPR
ncbi:phosphate signaling complex PhoU family protein [Arsukibacterium sp.]|uniref:phosphate signaling complex PhoU family protein n=1 Tax=Arsukibacterium sp. TaxID=1977258 RepID=UPI00299EE4AC|nr:PhoU domain-containing protein [Arsukibacterium sp.]MDX1677232.1 PhoU domain-containing protein [Arsukibacterium sp.]